MSGVLTRLLPALMDDLRACLCEALADDETCYCALYPGPLAVADWCTCKGRGDGCGMAWVRLDRLYPSQQFPIIDNSATSCGSPLAVVLEVGVYRCLPTVTGQGQPPNAAAQTNAVLRQTADAAAMHKALTCCPELSASKRPTMLGVYTPVAAGDCGGGLWQVTVQLVG